MSIGRLCALASTFLVGYIQPYIYMNIPNPVSYRSQPPHFPNAVKIMGLLLWSVFLIFQTMNLYNLESDLDTLSDFQVSRVNMM